MDTAKALEVLGLKSGPSPTALKKAYREQVKLWHPDRYSAGSAMKNLAEKNIQEANLAYAFLKRRTKAPLQTEGRPHAHETNRRSDRPQSPCSAILQVGGRRLRAALRAVLSGTLPGRLWKWLQHDPRNRFRPCYRYPDARRRRPENQHATKDFDRVLQDALQNRCALKHIHRARRRLSARDGSEKVTPVEAIARTRKSDGHPSSEKR